MTVKYYSIRGGCTCVAEVPEDLLASLTEQYNGLHPEVKADLKVKNLEDFVELMFSYNA